MPHPQILDLLIYTKNYIKSSLKMKLVKTQSAIPLVSLSDFVQSRMTKDGHPSTVTTVRLEGGVRGGPVTF